MLPVTSGQNVLYLGIEGAYEDDRSESNTAFEIVMYCRTVRRTRLVSFITVA